MAAVSSLAAQHRLASSLIVDSILTDTGTLALTRTDALADASTPSQRRMFTQWVPLSGCR